MIMENLQAVHDNYEGLHENIQSTICTEEEDIDVNVTSLYINSLIAIYSILNKETLSQPGYLLIP